MIWLDITDPKYVLFFKSLIPLLKQLDSVLVTTRKSKNYDECAELLKLFNIDSITIGGYGGIHKIDKLKARLSRQEEFLKLFKKIGVPKIFITGVSVEGTQTAFGLGIPIIQFSDTPIIGYKPKPELLSIVARLTLPLSTLIFYPFVLPQKCFTLLGLLEENLIAYNFIDVALWLKNMPQGKDFRDTYQLDKSRPTILIREEEYQAHYVKTKLPIIYESIHKLNQLDVNLVIMPRYGDQMLQENFGTLKNVFILQEKLPPQNFYPYINLLIGGGGTMNLEACYLGIPTISTRSLFLFHDKYLLRNKLMLHCKSSDEVFYHAKKLLQKNNIRQNNSKFFEKSPADFKDIFLTIKNRFYD